MSEQIRRATYADAPYVLADICAWLFSFAGKLHRDNPSLKGYSEWILKKYPLVCHVCGKGVCICSAHRDISERRERAEEFLHKGNTGFVRAWKSIQAGKSKSPQTPDDFVEMFYAIYGGALYGMPIEEVAFHFLEEVGEVSIGVAVSDDLELKQLLGSSVDWKGTIAETKKWAKNYGVQLDKAISRLDGRSAATIVRTLSKWVEEDIRDELADVFSWIAGLLYKLNQVLAQSGSLLVISRTLAGGTETEAERIPLEKLLSEAAVNLGTPTKPSLQGYVRDGSFICPHCSERTCSRNCVSRDVLKRVSKEFVKRTKRFEQR